MPQTLGLSLYCNVHHPVIVYRLLIYKSVNVIIYNKTVRLLCGNVGVNPDDHIRPSSASGRLRILWAGVLRGVESRIVETSFDRKGPSHKGEKVQSQKYVASKHVLSKMNFLDIKLI